MTTTFALRRPTMDEALTEFGHVGSLVGGSTARLFAEELRGIIEALERKSARGPKSSPWATEAMRLKLLATVAMVAHRRREALATARRLADQLPDLEGKAVDAEDRQAVAALKHDLEQAVAEEVEQVRLRRGSNFDGKAFADWSDAKEQDLEKLMRRIGGYRERGAEPGPLGWDEIHLSRASALIEGAEPESDDERRALARWQERWA